MPQKLVSIIIPTFNRAHLVVQALDSARSQSYPATQIIVIDDGSSDDTAAVVAKFENVEYYYQENKGQAAARNLGLHYAKGEYIASLDSDDIWHRDFLTAAVGALERFQSDFVFLNWTQISENGTASSSWERSKIWQKYSINTNGEWSLLDPEQVRGLFLETCPAPSSALVIRRSSFVSGWNVEMRIADDWFLILEMALTKPCRAAFTLTQYWVKHTHSSNIYDGREKLEVIRDLGLHDESLFVERFREHLSFREKAVLQRRIATHHLNFGRLNWQREGASLHALRSIATAFALAPVNSTFYSMQHTFFYLKNQLRPAGNK